MPEDRDRMLDVVEPAGPGLAGHPLTCPSCGGVLDAADRGRTCEACRRARKAAYELSMGCLVLRAEYVGRKIYEERQFLEDIGPEIAHLACEAFGHPKFNMDTWVRLLNWLECDHGLRKGALLGKTSRAKVVDMLRAKVDPAAVRPGRRRAVKPKPIRASEPTPTGRPRAYDPEADKRISDEWERFKAGSRGGLKDFSASLGLSSKDVNGALDRHRKRIDPAPGRRKKHS